VVRVLRLGAGDAITLFDGTGTDFPARIISAGRRGVTVDVAEGRPVHRESPLRIELLQGICRGTRMDTVLQKATELGVTVLRPVSTERTVVHLDEARTPARMNHWRGVVISACEQSGRSVLPRLDPPLELDVALASLPADALRLMLDPAGLPGVPAGLEGAGTVVLLVGPEGGLSPGEVQRARDAGFRPWRLGPRILRTETAPLAALAILQHLAGDLATDGPGGATPGESAAESGESGPA
jgi:16S rRNA (uracil1498-N3)-methyltransferase